MLNSAAGREVLQRIYLFSITNFAGVMFCIGCGHAESHVAAGGGGEGGGEGGRGEGGWLEGGGDNGKAIANPQGEM